MHEHNSQQPYTLLLNRIEEQEAKFGRRWVLFTDIDRTAYRKGIDNSSLFEQIRKGRWGLVYTTGRHLEGVIDLVRKGELPLPQAVAANVGTRLYFLKEESGDKEAEFISGADFTEDREFTEKARESGFVKSKVHSLGKRLIAEMARDYGSFELQFQEHEKENSWRTLGTRVDPYKVSFNYKIPHGTPRELRKNFIKKIKERFQGYCVVKSLAIGYPEKNVWCLDIVPFAKDKAIRYLNKKLNVSGLIAGDSGNDLHMLLGNIGRHARDFLRIFVGGATHDVLEELAKTNFKQEIASWAYYKHRAEEDSMYAYIEARQDCLGPISLTQAMREAEQAYGSFAPVKR